MTRVNIRAILADAQLRRRLMVSTIIAVQAREGIVTSREQAEGAYDKVQLDNLSRQDGLTGPLKKLAQ